MLAIHQPAQHAPGDVVGIFCLARQAGDDLAADALDRLLVEARLGPRQTQQLEGTVSVLRQGRQRAVEAVEPGLEAQADREIVELALEGLGVERAGAFVDRAGGHVRSEENTSELQSLMRISYAVFCLKKTE